MIHGVSLVAQERPYFLAPITSELQRDKTNAAADSYALVDIDVVDMTSGKPDLSAYPTTFFVDRTGQVVDYEIGFFSESRLQKKVEKLLHSDLEQTKPAG